MTAKTESKGIQADIAPEPKVEANQSLMGKVLKQLDGLPPKQRKPRNSPPNVKQVIEQINKLSNYDLKVVEGEIATIIENRGKALDEELKVIRG